MKFPTYDELNAFYGNPDKNSDGLPDKSWEAENLIRVKPPYPMVWSWDGVMVKTITLHKKCTPAFVSALEDIRDNFNEFERNKFHLDRCGGGYNFRLMRGSNRLSVHSWGAALDLAPEKNWLGRKYDERLGMIPMEVVNIFTKYGIRWGGKWQRPDSMHFEATS